MSLPITAPTNLDQAIRQMEQCSAKCAALELENDLGDLRANDVRQLVRHVDGLVAWYKSTAPTEIPRSLNALHTRVTELRSIIAERNGDLVTPPTENSGSHVLGPYAARAVVIANLHLLDGLLPQ